MWKSKIPAKLANDRRALKAVLGKIAADITEHARGAAPVDTGFLKNSINFEVSDQMAIVFVGAEYGIYVELGTVRMGARPYLGPAVEAVIPRLGGEVRREFSK